MNGNEWPLVFFTLLAQISVGMVVCMLIVAASFRNQSSLVINRVKQAIILTALVFMGVALLISFLHLTQPLHSVHALQGLKTSWLSREILLASFYLVLLAISFVAIRFNILAGRQQLILLFVTALIGLLLIYTMVRLYMLPTIPAWNNASTPVSFFNTALLAGSALTLTYTALFCLLGMDTQAFARTVKILAVMVFSGIIIHAVNAIILTPEKITHAEGVVVFLPELAPAIWSLVRWGFLIIGSAALILWLLRFSSSPSYVGLFLVCLATDCFLLAEVCARYLFYASYYRVGV